MGGFSLRGSKFGQISIKSHKARCVLAYILYNSSRSIRRGELVDLLWHDRIEQQGRASLRQAIYDIRTALGTHVNGAFNFGRDTIDADRSAFEFDLWTGPKGELDLDCTGELLVGLDPASEVFDEWIGEERREVDRLRLTAAEKGLDLAGQGQSDPLAAANRLLNFDPCHETATLIVMEAYAAERAVSQVVRAYSNYTAACDELGFGISENIKQRFEDLRATVNSDRVVTLQTGAREKAGEKKVPVIAVAPFRVLGDQTDEHLEFGLQDEIIGRLTLLSELQVLSQSEGRKIAEADEPLASAKSLDADYYLTGTISPSDTTIRARFQMSDAVDKTQVWSDRRTFNREDLMLQIEALIDEIATTLVPALERAETIRIETKRPSDFRAYDHYLKAKHIFFLANDPTYVEQAEAHLEKSIEIDPTFSPAYVHLIQSLNTGRIFTQPGTDLETGRNRALLLADRLLKMDRRNPNAHLALCWCLLWKQQFEAAERSLEEAITFNPIEAHRLNAIGTALLYLGRKDDAEAYYARAQKAMAHDLDYLRTDYGELYYLRQDYQNALTFLDFGENRLALRNQFWRAITLAQLDELGMARAEMSSFLKSTQSRWRGQQAFTDARAIKWVLDIIPLKLKLDENNIHDGLAKLGFSVSS